MNIFEQAVRQQLRLPINGSISIEQLYNAKPTKDFIKQLQVLEEDLSTELSKFEKPSRRSSSQKTARQKELVLQLEIVTSYLDEQEETERQNAVKLSNAERRQEVMAELALRNKEDIKNKPTEELLAELATLQK
jgi:hypothetical protein